MNVVVAASVTRDRLGLTDLDINDGTNYVLRPPFGIEPVSYRRQSADSPFVHGEITTHRARELTHLKLDIDVLGDTHADLLTARTTLYDAFSQDQYNVILDLDGTTWTWVCWPADRSVGMIREWIHNNRIPISFTIPRQPDHSIV